MAKSQLRTSQLAEFRVWTGRVVNATPTEIFLDGVAGLRFLLAADTTCGFNLVVSAKGSDNSDKVS